MSGESADPPVEPKRSGVVSALRRAWDGAAAGAPWLQSRRFVVAAVICAGLIGLMGAGVGYVAARKDLANYIRVHAIAPVTTAVRHWLNRPEQAQWGAITTELGAVQTLGITIADPDSGPMAALEELDGHLIFMTQRGEFSSLTAANELRSLDIDVPMNTAALRARAIPNFDYSFFRALDLLAIETAPHAFDLYASHHWFNATDGCFEIVVSRMRMSTTDDGIASQSGWEDVFVTTPCVPPKDVGEVFCGIQSGGRLVRFDDHTLLLSVGDLEYDGITYPNGETAPNGPQDPNMDLGKIISINLTTGVSERWARGFRNPQGFAMDAQGRLWETEHGPRGGDEINLLHRGGNYGWPNATYGMRYSPQVENWPLNQSFGGHAGYDLPQYVFVPSIGISQLLQPSAEAFPFWSSTLLVTSLAGRTLYAVRLEGDRVMYAEPIVFGERLRDIIQRANGEIAMVSDTGSLLLIRASRDGDATFVMTDRRTHRAAAQGASATPADAGSQLFAQNCRSCHSLNGAAAVGPPLNGVVGRDIGSAPFAFSPALRNADGVWTEQRLASFLTDPQAQFAGTAMPDPSMSSAQARDLVAYLRTTGEH